MGERVARLSLCIGPMLAPASRLEPWTTSPYELRAHVAARMPSASTAAGGSLARWSCSATAGSSAAVAAATPSTTRARSSIPRTTTIGSGSTVDEANERRRVDMESNRGCHWVCVPHDRPHRRHFVVGVEQPGFVAMKPRSGTALTLSAASPTTTRLPSSAAVDLLLDTTSEVIGLAM